jgi:hypothetical protein
MDVEKRDAVAFVESSAFDVEQLASDFLQTTNRNVPRNQRVRHTSQEALLHVNIRPANLGDFDLEQCGVGFKIRFGNFTNLDRVIGFRNYGDEWHSRRIYCIKTFPLIIIRKVVPSRANK